MNIAFCGIGCRAEDVLNDFEKTGLANIVAFCDTDMGAPHTLNSLNKFPNAKKFQDFRTMFDKMGNEFEAVAICTPDFAHFPAAMQAMSMGKHVYVEKPLAHTFQEVELMMATAKKFKVATQMGNQGHSGGNYFQFKAWTEAGIIKDVTRINAHMNNSRRWHKLGQVTGLPSADEVIPSTLDWDQWLSARAFHKYSSHYTIGEWRSWYDFGNGALGDWGAHIIDTAHEFLKLGLPYEIDPVKLEGHNPFIFPLSSTLSFKFPEREGMPPLEVVWYDGINNFPELPKNFGEVVTTENVPPPSNSKVEKAKLPPGKEIYSKELTFKGGSHSSMLSIIGKENAEALSSKLPDFDKKGESHQLNFLMACQGEAQCHSSFDISGPLTQVFTLGVIAQRLNTKLTFDRTNKQITNNPVANQLLIGPPPRRGWEQYYKL